MDFAKERAAQKVDVLL